MPAASSRGIDHTGGKTLAGLVATIQVARPVFLAAQ
jgi:hypothetical protein